MPDALAPEPASPARAQAIEGADFVLAICTKRYRRAFERLPVDGGPSEVELIAQLARRRAERVVPALLEDGMPQFVPPALRSARVVYLPDQLPDLLRRIGATGTPAPLLPAHGEEAAEEPSPPTEPPRKRPERRIANVSLDGSAEFVGRTFELSAIRTALTAPKQGGAGEPLIAIGAGG